MSRSRLGLLFLAAACSIAAAGQEQKSSSSERQNRPIEEVCQPVAHRYRSAEESLQRAKAEGAAAKVTEKRAKDLDRARRDYCECVSRAREQSQAPLPAELEELCDPKTTLPTHGTDGGKAAPPAASPPTPQPGADTCAAEATTYEQTWMRYSENTGSKTLQKQLQSAKSKLCGCLNKHYAYEGVLPQPLRGFCEDRTILTPPYFPSRGETPVRVP